jgi:hypothetical protein
MTGSDGSVGFAIGPAVTDRALYWEERGSDATTTYSLEQVALPRDVRRSRTASTPRTSSPIAPAAADACDVAATVDAIYELANPRCATFSSGRTTAAGAIRRTVAPRFHAGAP